MKKQKSNDLTNQAITDLQHEKKYFASILSHDLRSPLSSVILLISYLKTKEEVSSPLPYMDMIEQSARKELDLMTTLLSLMRAGSDTKAETIEDIYLRNEVDLLMRTLGNELAQKHIKVILDVPAELKISTDAQIFVLVIKNLIKHGIHFSTPRKEIAVAAMKQDSGTTFEIKFTSQEMAQKNAEYFFSSDQLIENPHKEFPELIDLYFCRKLISSYNGTIHAKVDELTNSCSLIMTLK